MKRRSCMMTSTLYTGVWFSCRSGITSAVWPKAAHNDPDRQTGSGQESCDEMEIILMGVLEVRDEDHEQGILERWNPGWPQGPRDHWQLSE